MASNTATESPAPRHFAVLGLTVRWAHGATSGQWTMPSQDDLDTLCAQLVAYGYVEVLPALIVPPRPVDRAIRVVRYALACVDCGAKVDGAVHLHGDCPACGVGELDCAECCGDGFVEVQRRHSADLVPCSVCQLSGEERGLCDRLDAIMEVSW